MRSLLSENFGLFIIMFGSYSFLATLIIARILLAVFGEKYEQETNRLTDENGNAQFIHPPQTFTLDVEKIYVMVNNQVGGRKTQKVSYYFPIELPIRKPADEQFHLVEVELEELPEQTKKAEVVHFIQGGKRSRYPLEDFGSLEELISWVLNVD